MSVIVPFYNSEKTLRACLQSLDDQTLKDLEIILVDDGSTDESHAIAKEFKTSYRGDCSVLTKENGGPASARNCGLEVARGDFVAFVDSDDTVDSGMFEKMVANADRYDSDIVSCGRVAIDAATGKVIKKTVPGYDVLEGPLSACPAIVKRVGPLMCDKMFRRSVIEEHAIRFDEDIWYAEDFLFGTCVKLHVRRVSAVRESLYRYIQGNDESITGGGQRVMDIPEVSRRVVGLYKNAGLLELVSDQLLYVLAGFYLRRCRSLPGNSNVWKSYKSEFKALFESYFQRSWRKMVAKRILKEDRGLKCFALLSKALL